MVTRKEKIESANKKIDEMEVDDELKSETKKILEIASKDGKDAVKEYMIGQFAEAIK